MGGQVVPHNHVARRSSGTSTCSTYDSNAAVSVDPGNTSGARTPSTPSAAITVSDSHEPGAEPWARSPRGAQP